MSADMWFCVVNGKQEGPFTLETLREMGAATPFRSDMLVWTEGMTEWSPLAATPLAAQLASLIAPPSLPMAATVQAAPHNVGSQMSAINTAFQGSTTANAPGFVDAIKICLTKYADFNGRASLPEYWWFILFNVILTVLTLWIPFVGFLLTMVFLLPCIAVGARRLHDIDRSGWWQLLWFIPLIGFVVLVVFFCQRGTNGANRFG